MSSKVYKRNIGQMVILTIITLGIGIAFLYLKIISIVSIMKLGNDFQYNILNFSGVLAGFLFAGIGILLSAIDKERIQRLWKHHYLDSLYYSAIGGIFFCVVNIMISLFLICCDVSITVIKIIITIEFIFILLSVTYFCWCTIKLFKLILKLKE